MKFKLSESIESIADLEYLGIHPHVAAESPLRTFLDCCVSHAAAPALRTDSGREYTYQELEELSRYLVNSLRYQGIEPGEVVAVYGGKEPAVYISLLALLRGGYVALPIDSSLPEKRRENLSKAARTAFGLFCSESATPPRDINGFRLNPFSCRIEESFDRTIRERRILPEPAAYIFFTSGTTGKPKGVVGTHSGLGHFISWQVAELQAGPGDRIPQLASISFDAMLKDLFLAVCSGAQLLLPPVRPYEDPERLLKWLDHEEATIVQTVPSVAASWLTANEESPVSLKSLRLLCLAGEPLTKEIVDRWRQSFPASSGKIINLYGPTEATILKSFYRVPEHPPDGILPLGIPLPQTKLVVVDAAGEAVRPGEIGEIIIQTAHGTLGSIDELDQGANGWRQEGEVHSFSTGDLGRYDQNGLLLMLGRMDDQVKINGVRVHPAEITSVLAGHSEVKECAVIPFESAGSGASLVAYVVPTGNNPDVERIRLYLASHLPSAMVPGHFVFLERMPLNANGKLDKRALPLPFSSPSFRLSSSSPVVEVVRSIWARVMKVSHVGPDDNFFELGGHSLLMASVIARVRKIFNCEISLESFFKNPTFGAMTAEVIAAIDLKTGHASIPHLVREPRENKVPLSMAQFRIWFLAQLDPGSTSYNMAGAIRLPESITEEAVYAALVATVKRHEALRTTIGMEEDKPIQIIHPEPTIDFRSAYLPEGSHEEQWNEARRLAAGDAREPFNLQTGPLIRTRYIQLGANERLLALTIHHIVCDGWSWGLIAHDFLSLCTASTTGVEASLPEVRVQYADYTIWQNRWLSQEVVENQLNYWRERLRDCPATTLPTTRPRPRVLSSSGSSFSFRVSEETSNAIRALAIQSGATPFMVLLAAFAALVARQTGNTDVVIGSDVSGRRFMELENVVGFFVGTVALRFELPQSETFTDLVGKVRQTILGAYEHQDVPFERIVEELNPERDLNRSPLFQIMFRTPPVSGQMKHPDLEVVEFGQNDSIAKFDLTFIVKDLEGRINCAIEYSNDLFDQRHIEFLARQYDSLLTQAVQQPEKPVNSHFIAAAEIREFDIDPSQLVAEPEQVSVIDMLGRIAGETPNAIAVTQESAAWTYQQLWQASEEFAAQLLSESVGRGSVICLHGPSCFEVVIGIIAVMRLGAVVVPLDDRLPDLRKVMLVQAAEADLIVQIGNDSIEGETNTKQVSLKHLRTHGTELPPVPPLQLEPETPAYVFFTSGSTGTPKAVLGQHKGLAHFVSWEISEFGIGPSDAIAQLTSFSFDAVLREIFVPLCSGGRLCLPPSRSTGDAVETLNWLANAGVSVLHTVPSVFASWAYANGTMPALYCLRIICLSGEPLPGPLVQKWRSRLPGSRARFFNFYGTTECTMIQSNLEIPDGSLPEILPIGPGIYDTQLFVLAGDDRLCGVGELGEIIVRTKFGSLGYYRSTNSCFLPNPFTNSPADPIYRTGDLGRLNSDRSITVLGRKNDSQLKIRGVRVDLSEVLEVLRRHPDVERVFTIPWTPEKGVTELLAYVVSAPGKSPAGAEIRSYMAQWLPAAMVPSRVFVLDDFPLLPNGKIDRSKLPHPANETASSGESPQTETERKIAALWASLLGVEQVFRNDDFFEIGGHSLLATALISEVRRSFGAEASLRSLFEKPTLASFAQEVDELRRSAASSGDVFLTRLNTQDAKQPLYCIHPISGGVGCYRGLAAKIARPVFGIQALGIEEGTSPVEDLRTLARIYVDAILDVHQGGPIHLLGWSLGGVLAYEIARQLKMAGELIGLVALLDTYAPTADLYSTPEELGQLGVIRNLLADLSTLTDRDLQSEIDLASAPEEERLTILCRFLIDQGVISVDQQPSDLERRANVIVSNLRAVKNYRFRSSDIDCTLFHATEEVRTVDVTQALCWDQLAVGDVEVIDMPGTHRTMISKHADRLALELNNRLDAYSS